MRKTQTKINAMIPHINVDVFLNIFAAV